jgi:hypothetical protein
MDRERLVSILNNKENIQSYIELLIDYCIEHNKPIEETKTFISFIAQTPFFSNCLNVAIDYYKNKLNIIEVIDLKTNKTILIY